jgi:hypothetical protein
MEQDPVITVLPFVAQGASRTLALSALPDAPIVHEADRPRRASLLSRVRRSR